jgi:hypothetical protein
MVPLEYMFSNKDAHRLLNTVLDTMFFDTRWTPDPKQEGKTRLALKAYAEANWYTNSHFYEVLMNDHGAAFERISADI